ncbi:unnamed protein product [Amoebophrya sp. A120]|nr:unnamed protein product [Amoebophrya sp. A120]|eukprot:GSA120T00004711001.1
MHDVDAASLWAKLPSGNIGDEDISSEKEKMKPPQNNPDVPNVAAEKMLATLNPNFEQLLEQQFPVTQAKIQLQVSDANMLSNNPNNPMNHAQQQEKILTILDSKRNQHLSIVFKQLPPPNAIIDVLNGIGPPLTPEQATLLYKEAFITDAEKKKMGEIHVSRAPGQYWGTPEQYFIAVTKAPRSFQVLRAWSFLGTFGPQSEECRLQLKEFEQAILTLQNNPLLEKILHMMLLVGNRMNAGTVRGNSRGFNIDSLHKFGELKNVEGNRTLLSFCLEFVSNSVMPSSEVAENNVSMTGVTTNSSSNNTATANKPNPFHEVTQWRKKIQLGKRVCLDEIHKKIEELKEEAKLCSQDCYQEAERNPDVTTINSSPLLRIAADVVKYAGECQQLDDCLQQVRETYVKTLKYYAVKVQEGVGGGGNGSSENSPSNAVQLPPGEDFLHPFDELFGQILTIQKRGY